MWPMGKTSTKDISKIKTTRWIYIRDSCQIYLRARSKQISSRSMMRNTERTIRQSKRLKNSPTYWPVNSAWRQINLSATPLWCLVVIMIRISTTIITSKHSRNPFSNPHTRTPNTLVIWNKVPTIKSMVRATMSMVRATMSMRTTHMVRATMSMHTTPIEPTCSLAPTINIHKPKKATTWVNKINMIVWLFSTIRKCRIQAVSNLDPRTRRYLWKTWRTRTTKTF